jgi:hypothetical protein
MGSQNLVIGQLEHVLGGSGHIMKSSVLPPVVSLLDGRLSLALKHQMVYE